MNGRMVLGILWCGLSALLTYLPNVPLGTGPTLLIAGNVVIGVAVLLWGATAKEHSHAD